MNLFLISITVLLSLAYLTLLVYARSGWKKEGVTTASSDLPGVSIITPYRNEEKKLDAFLDSIRNQDYPSDKFELIAVNDHSEDGGSAIIENFKAAGLNIKHLTLDHDEAGKKDAIERGLAEASFDIVLTTDADTSRGSDWLKAMTGPFSKHEVNMVIGPVKFSRQPGLLNAFQEFELHAYQFVTQAFANSKNAILCNGSNLAYRKEVFDKSGGLSLLKEVSSGDDIFLLFAVKKRKSGSIVGNLNSAAVVETPAPSSISAMFGQKLRWASKSVHARDLSFAATAAIMIAVNTWAVFLPFMEWNTPNWPKLTILFFLIKAGVDLVMVKSYAGFLQRKTDPLYFIISSVLYPPYLMLTLFLSNIYKPSWKGRKISV